MLKYCPPFSSQFGLLGKQTGPCNSIWYRNKEVSSSRPGQPTINNNNPCLRSSGGGTVKIYCPPFSIRTKKYLTGHITRQMITCHSNKSNIDRNFMRYKQIVGMMLLRFPQNAYLAPTLVIFLVFFA
jgi:hypothetical protein